MRAQDFLDILAADGVAAALSSHDEEELAEIDEPRVAAAALAAKWATDHLLNIAEDFGISRHAIES